MNNYEMEPWFIRTSYDKNNYKFKKNGNNKINMNTNLDSSNESINIQNSIILLTKNSFFRYF